MWPGSWRPRWRPATLSCSKPASYTPLTAIRLVELIHASGLLPRGVVNLVTGPGGEVGEAIARHPGVDKVALTGSTEVGRRVMQLASETVKRVTLELGGKSPSLVLPDADLELATDGVLFGVFFNGGQSCEAGTRCFVPEALHDEFVARLVARARGLRLGDPLDLETDMGPLVSEKQRATVMRYIEIGKAEGATLATGGRAARVPGFERAPFVEPTIFANVRNGSRLAQEEIFGPVLAVIPYKNVTEAIEMANDTIYGLGAAVWSRDHARRDRGRQAHPQRHGLDQRSPPDLPHAPFGGYKQSGVGREHGIYGLLEYTQVKHIHVDLMQKRDGPAVVGYAAAATVILLSETAMMTRLATMATLFQRNIRVKSNDTVTERAIFALVPSFENVTGGCAATGLGLRSVVGRGDMWARARHGTGVPCHRLRAVHISPRRQSLHPHPGASHAIRATGWPSKRAKSR